MSARVHSINVSRGGVPKRAVDEAWIDVNGVDGDRQANRKLHGGPERAVCVYSLELIDALQAEGHPIFVGSTGENITIAGVDWAEVTPGTRLIVGGAAIEVASYTSPCKTIADSFVDGRYKRISQKVRPGWSRVYARVLTPGLVRAGDAVRLTPSAQLRFFSAGA